MKERLLAVGREFFFEPCKAPSKDAVIVGVGLAPALFTGSTTDAAQDFVERAMRFGLIKWQAGSAGDLQAGIKRVLML